MADRVPSHSLPRIYLGSFAMQCEYGNFVAGGIAKVCPTATETGERDGRLPTELAPSRRAAYYRRPDGAIDPPKWRRVTLP